MERPPNSEAQHPALQANGGAGDRPVIPAPTPTPLLRAAWAGLGLGLATASVHIPVSPHQPSAQPPALPFASLGQGQVTQTKQE